MAEDKKKIKNEEKTKDEVVLEENSDEEIEEDVEVSDENKDLEETKEIDNQEEIDEDNDIVDTKEVVNIEDVEKEIEEEKKEESIIKDDSLDDSFVQKNSNTKKIISIVLIIIILMLFIILICFLNKERKDKENSKKPNKDITDIVLTEEEKQEMINSYGRALESVILIHYQKSQVILSFDDADNYVELEDDVVCGIHEVYEDGTVYLDNCSVNGKNTEYSYGVKQEPKEPFDSTTMIKVYVNKLTNERSLSVFDNMENVVEYTVHRDEKIENPVLLENSDYVFYFDSEYNVKMKNFKTDKYALEGIKYSNLMPFRIEDKYYDTRYIGVFNGKKWGIYNLESSKAVVGHVYDYIFTLSTGISGPRIAVNTLKDTYIAVNKNDKYGVIDYTSGTEIIPIEHNTLTRSGNYLWATHNNETEGFIYDFSGNSYLTSGYDKIYGIAAGTYVLVEQKGNLKLIQLDGKVLHNYGKNENLGRLNFALEYGNGALFQFYKEDPSELSICVEYSYNPSTKKGESKDIDCGGVAKPVLYLYPEEETNVTVSFSNPEILETTYPKFNSYWNVKALPNGDLLDRDGKYYYALYWDEKKVHKVDFSEGFYVEKDNAIEFLEEKMSYIGLSDKERNEFIMYWLPILEKNEKSLVYFELTEERESYNKLLISPQPDSMLRVVIHIKKVDEKVNIKKQQLKKFNREGFSVVEWGGTTY